MNTWMALAMVALLAGCATKSAVPVNCEQRLSPINFPAAIADPIAVEPQVSESPKS